MLDHCATLQHLIEHDSDLELSVVLSPWVVEHVFVAERCLLHTLQELVETPVL